MSSVIRNVIRDSNLMKLIICVFLIIIALYLTIIKSTNYNESYNQIEYSHVKSNVSLYQQTIAVQNLIKRVLGSETSKYFNVSINPNLTLSENDAFHISKQDGEMFVFIEGTSGVAVASGLHYFIKHYLNCHISWDYNQCNITSSTVLPNVNLTIKYPERFRLFQNVCTTSYSYVWWDWTRWESEIDRWALNGINLAYALTGTEGIWTKIYKDLGLNNSEIDDYYTGPAFLAWNRMGNVRTWLGPLSDSWHLKQSVLQRRILSRMRELSITPILPAFSGIVPPSFLRLFPNAKFTKLGPWAHFNDKYCCPLLLEATDPLFQQIGSSFLREVIARYGTNHMYAADTFNENVPQTNNTEELKNISRNIYETMTNVDSNATWVLQGWMFVNEFFYWTEEKAEAILTAVPQGRLLVLDLYAELMPSHIRLKSFFGQPYIWCMLHNFGGTLGMHGSLPIINEAISMVRSDRQSMVGVGMVPEGINQNYVVYDFMSDIFWSDNKINLTLWFESYPERRYGNNVTLDIISTWQLLKDTVYSYNGTLGALHGQYKIITRPSLMWKPETWYNTTLLFEAWGFMLKSPHRSNNYNYDLVDITRQSLQVLFFLKFEILVSQYYANKISDFQVSAQSLINILIGLDEILGTEQKFLLGPWLNAAKSLGSNELESHLYESNARNQITLWGPNGEINDYAGKQWSGLVSSYYMKRWDLFLSHLNTSLLQNVSFSQDKYNIEVYNTIERPFTFDSQSFPDTTQGCSYDISKKLYKTWIG